MPKLPSIPTDFTTDGPMKASGSIAMIMDFTFAAAIRAVTKVIPNVKYARPIFREALDSCITVSLRK
jgi:hypothetical protein